MKFDLVLSNPPYNISSGGSNGTAGNTTFYKRFRQKALTLLKEGGNICFVCPKGIVKDLYDSPNQIDLIDLMVDENYWEFNTLYFVERNVEKHSPPAFKYTTKTGQVINKMFCRTFNEWGFTEYSRSKKLIDPVYALIDPKRGGIYGMTDSALSPAPRFWCDKLNGPDCVAYNGYADPGISGYVECRSSEDAHRLKQFMTVSKIPRFFQRKMRLKSQRKDFFRFSRRFDLSQIDTGFEYPEEYGLTDDEIRYIEEQVM